MVSSSSLLFKTSSLTCYNNNNNNNNNDNNRSHPDNNIIIISNEAHDDNKNNDDDDNTTNKKYTNDINDDDDDEERRSFCHHRPLLRNTSTTVTASISNRITTSQQQQQQRQFYSNSITTTATNNDDNNDNQKHKSKNHHYQRYYHTKFAILLTFITLLWMTLLGFYFSYNNNTTMTTTTTTTTINNYRQLITKTRSTMQQDNNNDNIDYSKYSCNYIYEITPINGSNEQCMFAKTCNGGDGIVLSNIIFCRYHRVLYCILLSPIILLWLILLFRLLGSTAEDYFSPALEMFSNKCQLPPRFAGVTLLALGNGAADVSATVAAITSDPELGYKLSLGALTGAAMFISCVISSAVIIASKDYDGTHGFICRGALTRDVITLLITVCMVYYHLHNGRINAESISSFLTLYCIFVCTVLIADIYHRAIVIPRINLYNIEQERIRQYEAQQRIHITTTTTTTTTNTQQQQQDNNNIPTTTLDQSVESLGNMNGTTPIITSTTSSTTMLPQQPPLSAFQHHQHPPPLGSSSGDGGGGVGIASKILMALSNYDEASIGRNIGTTIGSGSNNVHDNNISPTALTGGNVNNTNTAGGISIGGIGAILPMMNYNNNNNNINNNLLHDDPSHAGWGIESETLVGGGRPSTTSTAAATERPIVLHGASGILSRHGQGHRQHHLNTTTTTMGSIHDGNDGIGSGINGEGTEYSILNDDMMIGSENNVNLCIDSTAAAAAMMMVGGNTAYNVLIADTWYEAIIEDGYIELIQHFKSIWDDIIESDDDELHMIQKILLICELPLTAARQLTVPIPCDGFYVRSVTAISLCISPVWFTYYLARSHEYNLWVHHTVIMICIECIAIICSLLFIRYGPPTHTDGLCPMPLYLSTPMALYGFVIAATWIDSIADALVSLLNFIGIILHIPGPVIGLTVLAWGNSMGDLSANMTMARKGLANMAMTACFAGPVFNILVGLGLGFSSLAAQTGNISTPVSLSPSVSAGFIFLAINACSILYTGLVYGKGVIPYQYGYVALFIYTVYVITSISLQYSNENNDNNNK